MRKTFKTLLLALPLCLAALSAQAADGFTVCPDQPHRPAQLTENQSRF